jgi:hypothetical protein
LSARIRFCIRGVLCSHSLNGSLFVCEYRFWTFRERRGRICPLWTRTSFSLSKNNEKAIRKCVRAKVVGGARVRSYEDIVDAQKQRDIKEAAAEVAPRPTINQYPLATLLINNRLRKHNDHQWVKGLRESKHATFDPTLSSESEDSDSELETSKPNGHQHPAYE